MPSCQRPKPCQHLAEREGLDEVVVGSGFQAVDAVVDRVSCREHEDGGLDALLSQSSCHLEAVEAGQHHVEHDRVVLVGGGGGQAVLSVVGHVGGHPRFAAGGGAGLL